MREYHKWRIYYKKRVSGTGTGQRITLRLKSPGGDRTTPPQPIPTPISPSLVAPQGFLNCPPPPRFPQVPLSCSLFSRHLPTPAPVLPGWWKGAGPGEIEAPMDVGGGGLTLGLRIQCITVSP